MPYRRYNPLQDKWVLTSPHRFNRPWSGQTENIHEPDMPEHDATCYLCPGNSRVGGARNPDYRGPYHFVNDFSALIAGDGENAGTKGDLFSEQLETGTCEVLCYHPAHNKTMASMSLDEIAAVIRLWQERYQKIAKNPAIRHIQIFENRGNEVGNSNPHPHGQLWAQNHIPTLPQTEIGQQQKYHNNHNSRLLLDYVTKELSLNQRIVYTNEGFTALVPFWAEWPYETLILPNFPLASILELPETKFSNLANTLSTITKAYAKVFQRPTYGAPYTMGLHQQPVNDKQCELQLHFHFQPPMLTPERQKFMVGYERFGEAQRDITAEQAAEQLRNIIEKF